MSLTLKLPAIPDPHSSDPSPPPFPSPPAGLKVAPAKAGARDEGSPPDEDDDPLYPPTPSLFPARFFSQAETRPPLAPPCSPPRPGVVF